MAYTAADRIKSRPKPYSVQDNKVSKNVKHGALWSVCGRTGLNELLDVYA